MATSPLNVIVGLGATGLSCVRFLIEQGQSIAVNDTRDNPPNIAEFKSTYPNVLLSLGQFDEALLNRADRLILSPGVALREPAIAKQVKRGIPVIGDIELFAQATTAPIIAITGTNAKSTVTTLVGLMATAAGEQVQTGGNLGVPALDLLSPNATVYVLELSSFQLETTHSLHARVATVLNITPDHMDRYDDLADYQRAKLRVYQQANMAVCNRDDALTACNDPSVKKQFSFTLQQPGQNEFGLMPHQGETWLAFEKTPLMSVNELPVAGKHYQANALAALALGYAYGWSFESMLHVLRTFTGLPHRCQFVREYHGVRWYNDSKGTNVGATQAAIEGLGSEVKGRLILIAGGVGKNADFEPLLPAIEKYSRHVVLIGEAAATLADVIGKRLPLSFAKSMEDAVAQAAAVAKPEDSVLLSPACASFDMFKNYAHRGDVFTDIVKRLSL